MARLDGRVAIVTGAGRGIGQAIATLLAAEGASVLIADIDESTAAATAEALRRAGGQADHHRVDVSKAADVRAMAALNSASTTHACYLGAGAYEHYVPAVAREDLRRQCAECARRAGDDGGLALHAEQRQRVFQEIVGHVFTTKSDTL